MQTVTITFEQVFSVKRTPRLWYSKCHQFTSFGFSSHGEKRFSAKVPGQPKIEQGQTVTAVLGRKNDWSSVLGWVNHTNGETACRDLACLLPHIASGTLAFVVAISLFASPQKHWHISIPALFVALALLFTAMQVWRCRLILRRANPALQRTASGGR